MLLLTYSNIRNVWLYEWEHTARHWGYDFKVIGLGQQWQGFETKTRAVIDHLATVDGDTLVVVCDCHDVVLSGPPDELVAKYDAVGKPLVIGGEEYCSVFNCYKHNCPMEGDRCNVNGGFAMGRAVDLLKLYRYIMIVSPDDDQIGLGMYVSNHCSEVHVDTEQAFIANVVNQHSLQTAPERRFVDVNTGAFPCIVHTPGIHLDMGKRSLFVRSHAIPHYAISKELTTAHLIMRTLSLFASHKRAKKVIMGWSIGILVAVVLLVLVIRAI
jgi:hypothetical protein